MGLRLNLVLFVVSVLILIALVVYSNPMEVISNLAKFDIFTIGLLIFLAAVGLILRFIRFKLLLDRKYNTPAISLFPVFVFGLSLANTVPGRAAEPIRALLIKKVFAIPTGYTLASIFFERLSDMIVILAIATLAFIAVKAEIFLIPFIIAILAVILVVVATQSKRLYFTLIDVMKRTLLAISNLLFKKQVRDITKKLEGILKYTYSELRFSKMLGIQIILSLLIWGVAYSALLYLSLSKLGAQIDYLSSAGIFALSLVVGLVSFLPGGLGSTEAAMTILLKLAGVEYSIALTAAIVMRALSLWDVIILGPICSLFIKEKKA
jgi:uncharacterized protein (TIRG00374 family)